MQVAEFLKAWDSSVKNDRNAVDSDQYNPSVYSGSTRGLLTVEILSDPYTMLLQPFRNQIHKQPSSTKELGSSIFHLQLRAVVAANVDNQTGLGGHKRIVAKSPIISLRNEIKLVQSTQDAHHRILQHLPKPYLCSGDTASHGPLTVSTNRHTPRLPVSSNHLQHLAAKAELVFCGLFLKQWNRNDVNVWFLPVLGASSNS